MNCCRMNWNEIHDHILQALAQQIVCLYELCGMNWNGDCHGMTCGMNWNGDCRGMNWNENILLIDEHQDVL